MDDTDDVEALEQALRDLDERIARVRHELIWRKREVRPGFEPVGIDDLEAEYSRLADQFKTTWIRWNRAHRAGNG